MSRHAKERFSTIIDDYISSENYEEINRLSEAGYLNHEFLAGETVKRAEAFLFEYELIGLLRNNQLEEITIKTVNHEEGTVLKNIYHLAQAIKHETEDPSMVTTYLVSIPEGYSKFPQPFQEKYDALYGKYRDTEKYKYAKMVRESHERQDRKNNITKTIQIGMTTTDVQSLLGNPTDINTNVSAYGTSEQWVYKD
ncbi:hypothetical protein [Niallia sp. Krafla_26]|uniref:hypothetical protein n=1 Tax=Niallia sp. Krafla_26 TaxID=3064703 RepID=UPI003D178F6E